MSVVGSWRYTLATGHRTLLFLFTLLAPGCTDAVPLVTDAGGDASDMQVDEPRRCCPATGPSADCLVCGADTVCRDGVGTMDATCITVGCPSGSQLANQQPDGAGGLTGYALCGTSTLVDGALLSGGEYALRGELVTPPAAGQRRDGAGYVLSAPTSPARE